MRHLNDIEAAAVMAGLRLLSIYAERDEDWPPEVVDILTNNGAHPGLDSIEIDDLANAINWKEVG